MYISCGSISYFFLHIYSIKIFLGHDTVKVIAIIKIDSILLNPLLVAIMIATN